MAKATRTAKKKKKGEARAKLLFFLMNLLLFFFYPSGQKWNSHVVNFQKARLREVSLLSWSVEQNARDTQMTTRVTEGARRERHDKRETTRKPKENGLLRSSDFLA